jgi:hypothetical protein
MDQRFLGIWDVYHGPVVSRLALGADATYRHALWDNSRSHWGNWSFEGVNGRNALVMRLAGAVPMLEMTPYGVQPIVWPPREMWAVTEIGPNLVLFADGRMFREAVQPQMPVPMQPFAAAPMPPPLPAASTASAGVVPQWQNSHTDWAAVRQIYQNVYTQDQKTSQDIAAGQNDMLQQEIAARQANMQALSGAIHAGVPAFMNAQKGRGS